MLQGKDARSKVTIIDDDNPGQIVFQEKGNIRAPANSDYAEIVIDRIKGADGLVTVDYETVAITDGALEGIDFRGTSGKLEFQTGDKVRTIKVEIIQH